MKVHEQAPQALAAQEPETTEAPGSTMVTAEVVAVPTGRPRAAAAAAAAAAVADSGLHMDVHPGLV